ncbi:hypothetical protein [Nostoc sp. NZL]|uniref:hypothetical protein n=1 Tax=Nostoc sp. NZL TaxID=2650612 RepID=UPI0018C61244|nr:hypothetical protein [Nostoc sp. NZL]
MEDLKKFCDRFINSNWRSLRDFQIKKYTIAIEAGGREQGAGGGIVVVKSRNWII